MSIKLLLLEDDFLFGESIQDVLEEEGYAVTLCRNGNEALEATFLKQVVKAMEPGGCMVFNTIDPMAPGKKLIIIISNIE